jgi:hypothetical protein
MTGYFKRNWVVYLVFASIFLLNITAFLLASSSKSGGSIYSILGYYPAMKASYPWSSFFIDGKESIEAIQLYLFLGLFLNAIIVSFTLEAIRYAYAKIKT